MITRVEVIDNRNNATSIGRVLVVRDETMSATYQLQDDGRTLKVFLDTNHDNTKK